MEESKKQVESLLEIYAASELRQENEATIRVLNAKTFDTVIESDVRADESEFVVGWFTQIMALMWRTWITIMRDPTLTKARAIQSVILALIVGLIYLRLGNTQTDIQNRMGAIFFCLINQSFGGVFGTLQTFPAELPIFRREFKASMYSSHAYYLARTIVELPFQCLWPFIFVTIAYWMIGLRDDGAAYIEFVLVIILTANCAISLGYLISTLAPTTQVALAISTPILLPFMLFGGLFINVNSIPDYFYWISYISFFKYAYELLSIIVWNNQTIASTGDPSDLTTGAQVLSRYGMDSSNVSLDIGVLFALAVGFRFISYMFLWRRANFLNF